MTSARDEVENGTKIGDRVFIADKTGKRWRVVYSIKVPALGGTERLRVLGEVGISRCNRDDIFGNSKDPNTPCRSLEKAGPYNYDPLLEARLGDAYQVERIACASQIGSGALPLETVPSAGIAIRPAASRGQGRALATLATALRNLPAPVIGRVADGGFVLDLRCLEDEAGFAANLKSLDFAEGRDAGA